MVLLMDFEIKQIKNGWLLYGGTPDDKKVVFCQRLYIACDAIVNWENLGFKEALKIVAKDNESFHLKS